MDQTKNLCAVVTMVYKDYEFLQRWVDYYSKHFGAENLYILSHGGDAIHKHIAGDANYIEIPRDPTMYHFDRRRWGMLSDFNGMLQHMYNWVITTDVDEIVLVDPDVSRNLDAYLRTTYPDLDDAPRAICPFGVELVHNPDLEPDLIKRNEPILKKRKIFRPSANYSKPCLNRVSCGFTPGGHGNSTGRRHLSSDLYLLHLRFYDYEFVTARMNLRRDQVQSLEWLDEKGKSQHGWSSALEIYLEMHTKTPVREDIVFQEFRDSMMKQHEKPGRMLFAWGNFQNEDLYTLPERFSTIF